MFIVVALGNTGDRYVETRHNAAWLVLDTILADANWQESKHGKCLYWRDLVAGEDIEYIKPLTMMNLSGQSLAYALRNHPEVTPDQVIVLHDDTDIPVGEFKISVGKGTANHNGVESITKVLQTRDYVRIRIGVGHHGLVPLREYVLQRFSPKELQQILDLQSEINNVITTIVQDGVAQAMNVFN